MSGVTSPRLKSLSHMMWQGGDLRVSAPSAGLGPPPAAPPPLPVERHALGPEQLSGQHAPLADHVERAVRVAYLHARIEHVDDIHPPVGADRDRGRIAELAAVHALPTPLVQQAPPGAERHDL